LESEGADAFDDVAFEAAVVEEVPGFDRAEPLLFSGRFAMRDDLRTLFADFGFGLLVAMWPSLCVNDSIMCCH
jgi:hypothetical protein